LIVVADSSYAALELLAWGAGLRRPVTMITRLRLDAALYEPAPKRQPKQTGRPALKGKRLPTLARRLEGAELSWQRCRLGWYGGKVRVLALTSGTAEWYHSGKPPVAIRSRARP
jgi:hypothetical protein